jgi:GAF domain-containing protein
MINRLRQGLFTVHHPYDNPIEQLRARGLLVMNWVVLIALILWIPFGLILPAVQGQAFDVQIAVTSVVTGLIIATIIWQIQNARLAAASWVFVVLMMANGILASFNWETNRINAAGVPVITLAIPLVAAGLLLKRRDVMIVTGLLFIILIAGFIGQAQNHFLDSTIPAETAALDASVLLTALGIVAIFLVVFASGLLRIASESVSRVQQGQWISELSVALAGLTTEKDVLNDATTFASTRFGYLAVQVYLMEENGILRRAVGMSFGQTEIIGRGLLRLTDVNPVSEAVQRKQAVTTTSDDPENRRANMLASAKSAVATALIYKDQILGALEVQSARTITPVEIESLQTLAGLVANALARVRAYSDLESSMTEQQVVISRLESQIMDLQQRAKLSVSDAWSRYLEGRGKAAVGFDLETGGAPSPAANLPPVMESTLATGALEVESTATEQIIKVPITFRDQTLGAMAFTVPKDQPVTQRQLEMAQVVAERLALALDNTRLFEQSQAQALRERKASEITSLLIGSTDVNTMLNVAAAAFNEALGAAYTRIYIQPDAATSGADEARKETAV